MYPIRSQRLLLAIMICSIAFLLSACNTSMASELSRNELARTSRQSNINTSLVREHISRRMPATQTNCPTTRPARAALIAHLAIGKQQNLVYTYNTSSAGILRRYNTSSGQKTTILSLDNATISDAQLSTDGQFILFATQVANRLAIQMIRIDGQGLQTLYCAPDNGASINFIDNLLWSPDQQSIVFRTPGTTGTPLSPIIQLLHVNTGQLQTIMSTKNHTSYIPRAWFSNTRLYTQGYSTNDGIPPHDVYLFDIQSRSIKHIALIQGYGWDLSLTTSRNELLLSQSSATPPQGQPLPPSIISIQPATGGRLRVIYASHVHAVTQVRSISATTLLFVLGGRFASGEQDGLWKINTDGSGLMLLTRDGKLLSDQHTVWSCISRDGRMYAAIGYDYTPGSDKMLTRVVYGPLSGGPSTLAAITQAGESAEIVGWTVL
jgi:eukaryotic-like serine/threonine-protein kinase